jgi:hypothetical protein
MLDMKWLNSTTALLRFVGGTNEHEAARFLDFLTEIERRTSPFVLVVETDGKSPLPNEQRKVFAAWYRTHKGLIKEKCMGVARVAQETGLLAKVSSKAFQVFFPVPLFVTSSWDDALKWAERKCT